MKVSIVIPAYNEEKRIGKTLEAYSDYLEGLRKNGILDYQILVVINNTKDNTLGVVKEHQKSNKRIQYLDLVKGGKGYAVIEGFKESLQGDFNLIGFTDADMATGPEAFYYLINNIGKNDAIIANRYDKDSKITPKYTFRRVVVAKVFNLIVNSLFFLGLNDTQCGAKLFTRKAAEFIANNVKMSQWAFDVELLFLLKREGFATKEAKTIWKDVDGSKINVKKASLQMLLSIIRLRIVYSPIKPILKPLKPIIEKLWRGFFLK